MNKKEYKDFIDERNFEIPQSRRTELGIYIKKLREEKKLSLTQLANLTKINVADLHKIEHGTKNKVNPFQLKALSKVLQIDYKIFYKAVGFLDEEDFYSDKNNKVIKNEFKNFKIELIENFLQNSKVKISEENFKLTLDIFFKLSDNKLESWLSYGKFLIKNTK